MDPGSESSQSQGEELHASQRPGVHIKDATVEWEDQPSEATVQPLRNAAVDMVKAPQPVELLVEEEADKRAPPVFLLSTLSLQERIDYAALIEQLGGAVCEATFYEDRCSHLVVGNPSRQEKYLACVAAGKWVLHKSYLEECRKQGRFVQEEAHEWGSEATSGILAAGDESIMRLAHAAHRWRLHVAGLGKNPVAGRQVRGAFEGWRVVILTSEKRVDGFRRMLEAGGALVVATRPPFTNLSSVTHAFMDLQKVEIQVNLADFLQAGVHCLQPAFMVSYLTDDPSPSEQTFYIQEVKAALASAVTSLPENTLFECAVCLTNMLERHPRALTCLHTFCQGCLQNLVKRQKRKVVIDCPTCQKKTVLVNGKVENLTENFQLKTFYYDTLTAQKQDTLCTVCKQELRHTKALYECTKCNLHLCNSCKIVHEERFKQKPHVIAKRNSTKWTGNDPSCDVEACKLHKNTNIEYWCQKCEELLCAMCAVHRLHRMHEIEDIEDYISEKLQALVTSTERHNFSDLFQNRVESLDIIETKAWAVKSKVADLANHMKRAIDIEADSLIDKCEEDFIQPAAQEKCVIKEKIALAVALENNLKKFKNPKSLGAIYKLLPNMQKQFLDLAKTTFPRKISFPEFTEESSSHNISLGIVNNISDAENLDSSSGKSSSTGGRKSDAEDDMDEEESEDEEEEAKPPKKETAKEEEKGAPVEEAKKEETHMNHKKTPVTAMKRKSTDDQSESKKKAKKPPSVCLANTGTGIPTSAGLAPAKPLVQPRVAPLPQPAPPPLPTQEISPDDELLAESVPIPQPLRLGTGSQSEGTGINLEIGFVHKALFNTKTEGDPAKPVTFTVKI